MAIRIQDPRILTPLASCRDSKRVKSQKKKMKRKIKEEKIQEYLLVD
jgi:hypothetical protein